MEIAVEITRTTDKIGGKTKIIKATITGTDYENKAGFRMAKEIISEHALYVKEEVGSVVINIEFKTLSQEKQKS